MKIDPTRTVNELITAVSMAMDIEEGTKLYHSWRVAIVAAHLAQILGEPDHRTHFYGGLLHDVGGVGLPHHLVTYLAHIDSLHSSDQPTDPGVISHPLLSAEIVSSLPGINTAARAVLDHHEHWNGHGFPRALHQHEIDRGGLILSAADITDLLLRTDPPLTLPHLIDSIWETSGQRLAPDIAEALIALLRQQLYDQLIDPQDLPDVFNDTRAQIGHIPVERGVDAIGVTLDTLSRVVDNKHPYTIGHSRRVARYSLLIGIALGLSHEELTFLKWAALIHDVGKLSVPALMLDKPTPLSPQEYQILQYHTSYTFDIVSMITDLRHVAAVASSHHERYDGAGYPLCWQGEDIPFGARIIAVADTFDAMTSHRPYRATNDVTAACHEIHRMAGTQFDPAIVKTAIPVLRHLGLVVATSA